MYITQKDFVTSNYYPDGNPGYSLFVFDIRHLQGYSSAHPFKVGFDFRPAVPAATNLIGYAFLLRNKKYQFLAMDKGNLIYFKFVFFHNFFIFFSLLS